MQYFRTRNNRSNTTNIVILFSVKIPEVYTIRPAFVKIPKKVISSKITSQFPIEAAPYGSGLR